VSGKRNILISAFLPCLVLFCSCGKRQLPITVYPPFYKEGEIKTVAVETFSDATGTGAGRIITGALISALSVNGTYEVYLIPEKPGPETRPAIRPDAVITGMVNIYNTGARHDWTPIYRYGYGYYHRPYGYHYGHWGCYPYWSVDYVHSIMVSATVAVSASMVKTSDGRVLFSTPSPIVGRSITHDYPSEGSKYDCLNVATGRVITGLVETFAVTRRVIEVKEKDALRVSDGRRDGDWHDEDKFDAGSPEGYIVVKLPPICDRNRFRITIGRRADDDEEPPLPVFDRTLTWDRAERELVFEFSPARIAGEGGGGKYEVRLYAAGKSRLRRKIRIGRED
jgi:hypothetical protein